MNKKVVIIVASIIIVAVAASAAYVLLKKSPASTSSTNTATTQTVAQELGQPARAAELKGYISSIEGNEVVIINEISTEELTDEQKAAQKAERQALSQEERQALKAQESETLQKENVRIIIPVGVPIKKTTGDASGNLVDAELAEIKEGTYVSIWVKDYKLASQTVEFVKIKVAS